MKKQLAHLNLSPLAFFPRMQRGEHVRNLRSLVVQGLNLQQPTPRFGTINYQIHPLRNEQKMPSTDLCWSSSPSNASAFSFSQLSCLRQYSPKAKPSETDHRGNKSLPPQSGINISLHCISTLCVTLAFSLLLTSTVYSRSPVNENDEIKNHLDSVVDFVPPKKWDRLFPPKLL